MFDQRKKIVDCLKTALVTCPDFVLFATLFGSVTRMQDMFSDVDLLIVVSTSTDISYWREVVLWRHSLNELWSQTDFPRLDLVILCQREFEHSKWMKTEIPSDERFWVYGRRSF